MVLGLPDATCSLPFNELWQTRRNVKSKGQDAVSHSNKIYHLTTVYCKSTPALINAKTIQKYILETKSCHILGTLMFLYKYLKNAVRKFTAKIVSLNPDLVTSTEPTGNGQRTGQQNWEADPLGR